MAATNENVEALIYTTPFFIMFLENVFDGLRLDVERLALQLPLVRVNHSGLRLL
jgi:hypothetical protein